MISIHKYTYDDRDVWDDFVRTAKNATFMHKRAYMDYHSDRFVDNSLMIYIDKKLVAILPASAHNNQLCSHAGLTYGGLVMSSKITVQQVLMIFEAVKNYCKQNGFISLIYKRVPSIYYRFPSDEDLYALFRYGATLIRRDISSTIYIPNKLNFSERRRRGCKLAQRNNIVVKQSFDYKRFVDILATVLKTHHNAVPVHTASELKLLANRFPDNIKLYIASKDNNMIAGVVLYITENVVHTQYIANSEEGRQIGALDIIFDFLINNLCTQIKYFDFGISTENEGLFLNEGLITQKQEFGGRGIVYDFYELKI